MICREPVVQVFGNNSFGFRSYRFGVLEFRIWRLREFEDLGLPDFGMAGFLNSGVIDFGRSGFMHYWILRLLGFGISRLGIA